jgi:UDP-glucose 4-epimerase
LAAGKTPTIHGDGQQRRDFVFVADCVQAILKAAEVPGVGGRVFNVGTGRSVSVLELVASLNRVLGTDLAPAFGPARPGDVRFSLAKIDRIRAELGFEPQVAFEDGLRKTLAG